MLGIDVALQVVPCKMYVAIRKSSKVAQKVDSCNIVTKRRYGVARKIDVVS